MALRALMIRKRLTDARKALDTLAAKDAEFESREADFEQLLLSEFKSTNDSLAVKMRSALVDPTDDQLLIEAGKWYELTK